ncbi:MAG: topoisomerase IV [Oscillospiraceae bacterium]|nr:topoisomerase IV [Oscillospiraceae bacterium]
MESFLIIAVPIAIIAVIAVVVVYLKKKANSENNHAMDENVELVTVDGGVPIPIERVTSLSLIDESSLTEITDSTVVARITQTIPTVAEKAAKTVTNTAMKKADLYRVIIPNGETLVQSKSMTGAFRGFFRGAKGAKGHANLVKVDPSKITKASTVANIGANVMNVGSLVVGQYYMNEINAKLETMNKNISKISDFQDREFKSRIMSLIALVGEISQFSVEIIENDELRTIKLAALENMKADGTELLGQVNETIIGITQGNPTPDYKAYQATVEDFYTLVEYQNILITILEEISKLSYLLGKGNSSKDMCYSLYSKYWELSVQARDVLESWHDKQVAALKIEIDRNRLEKSGVAGFFAQVPALFDDKWKYRDLKQGIADKITHQSQTKPQAAIEQKAVYDSDVPIVIMDGKYYYQHDAPATAKE